MPKKRFDPFAIFIGLFAFVSFVVRGALVGDPGFGWHLQNGAFILAQRSVASVDPFLYTPDLSRTWINNQWLADLIFYLSFQVGGWRGIHLLTLLLGLFVLCPVFVALLTRARCDGRGLNLGASICATLLTFFCVSVQWFSRPVQFSVLGFSILYYFVQSDVRWRERLTQRGFFLFTALSFCLWANLHPGFVFGLFLLCARVGADLIPSQNTLKPQSTFVRGIIVLFFAALATVINPFGIELHLGILQLIGDPFFQNLNAEWLPPTIRVSLFWPYFLSAAFLIAGVVTLRRKLLWTPFEILTLALFGILSMVSRRYIPFFGVVALLPLARTLSVFSDILAERFSHRKFYASLLRCELSAGTFSPSLSFFAAAIVATLLSIGVTGKIFTRGEAELAPETIFPGSLVQYVSEHKELTQAENRCVFNSPNVGGYLTWRLWPHFNAIVDDRNELNGHGPYETYFTVRRNEPGAEGILKETRCHFAIIEEDTSDIPFSSAGWNKVSCEKKYCLFERA